MWTLSIGYWWQGHKLSWWSCLLLAHEWKRKGFTRATRIISFGSWLLGNKPGHRQGLRLRWPARSRYTCESQKSWNPLGSCKNWISGPAGPVLPLPLKIAPCHGCVLCYPTLRNAMGCAAICNTKGSQSHWWAWWSIMIFPYPACRADFLARAVNSLRAFCPWEIQRCNSVSSATICRAGKKNDHYILVQSFSDKAEFSF